MCRYTIAKTLAFFLGVLSVVAHSLPEWRSEINVRSPGDVGDPRHPPEGWDFVKISEGVLNGNTPTTTYSMSNKTTFPKRDDSGVDLRSHICSTECKMDRNVFYPSPTDCVTAYKDLQSMTGTVTVPPFHSATKLVGFCVIGLSNGTPFDVTIDYLSIGLAAEKLTNECLIARSGFCPKTTATCKYEDLWGSPLIAILREWPESS